MVNFHELGGSLGNALNYGSILDIKDQSTINLYVRIQLKAMKFLILT